MADKLDEIVLNEYNGQVVGNNHEQNAGNPFEYLRDKFAGGFIRSFEGFADFAGGFAPGLIGVASGNKELTKSGFETLNNDWLDYSEPDKRFNPSTGWSIAGETAAGIGNSIPSFIVGGTVGKIAKGLGASGATAGTLAKIGGYGFLGASAAGNATGEAVKKTGELGWKELGYGALSGATEVGTELIGDRLGAGSSRIMSSIANSFGNKATKAVSRSASWGIIKGLLKDFAEEAFEEGVSEWLDPKWMRLTGVDENAQDATAQEILYAALIGGLSGVVMGAVNGQVESIGLINSGDRVVANGHVESALGAAKNILENGEKFNISSSMMRNIKTTYDTLVESLEKTNGQVKTVRQRMMLGMLVQNNSAAMVYPLLSRDAIGILKNSEEVARRMSAFMKDENGNPIKITAKDLVGDVNLNEKNYKKLSAQISEALATNPVLQSVAIMSFIGRLRMQTDAWVKYNAENPGLVNQSNLGQFVQTASEAEKAELGRILEISDWNKVSPEEVNEAFRKKSDVILKAVNSAASAKEMAKGEKNTAPKRFTKTTADGAYDIGDGYTVVKQGESFRVYNAQNDSITREIGVREVNALLNEKTREDASRKAVEEQRKAKEESEKVEEVARKAVENYDKLSETVKNAVRMTIRQASANGVSTEDMAMCAKISANTGLNVVFSLKTLDAARNAEGKIVYADAQYDLRNTVYVNPTESRTKKIGTLQSHELAHWIWQHLDAKSKALVYSAAVAGLGTAKAEEVMNRYKEVYSKTMSGAKLMDALFDEVQARYAEEVMTSDEIWDALLSDDASLQKKVPAFVKEWAKKTGVPEATKVAEAYAKAYTNAFKRLSAYNRGANAYADMAKLHQDVVMGRANFAFAPKHKEQIGKRFTKDAKISQTELMKRYDAILAIWKELDGEINSEFLKKWNSKKGKDSTFEVFKSQSGYKYNAELSTMCKKGLPLFEAIDAIVRKEMFDKLNTETLGKAEKQVLYDVLKSHGFEIPCAICYVEQARQREGKIISDFLNGNSNGKVGWNSTLTEIEGLMEKAGVPYKFPSFSRSIASESYVPVTMKMTEEQTDAFYKALMKIANREIDNYNASKEGDKKFVKKAHVTQATPDGFAKVFKGNMATNLVLIKTLAFNPDSRARIADDLLYSSVVTENLSRNHQDLYSLFNRQGGTAGYKTKQRPSLYLGEVLGKNMSSSAVRNQGGIRNQSNSDLQMYLLLDMVQMFVDASAKGYYIHLYTKVPAELKLLGLAGAKMNASAIPKIYEFKKEDGTFDRARTEENAGLDENGKLLFDYVEGINLDEVMPLINDPEYSKNVGIISIGYSDNHIRKLLADPRIQLIIGFHDKTNDPAKRYRGAKWAHNYNGENEAIDHNGKTQHVTFGKYLDRAEKMFGYSPDTEKHTKETVSFNGKEYSFSKAYDGVPKLAADLYLADIASKNWVPAYANFADDPNYYKLLGDFTLYNSEGQYAPHRKVQYFMPDTVPVITDRKGKITYGTQDTKSYIKEKLMEELSTVDKLSFKLENGMLDEMVEGINNLSAEEKATSVEEDIAEEENVASKATESRNALPETDSDGNKLSAEQGEFFENTKVVDKEGRLLKMYHGTDAEFDTFDMSKAGQNGRSMGWGFYFAASKSYAEQYGTPKEVYLNVTKPLVNGKKTMKLSDVRKLVAAVVESDLVEWKDEGLTWQDSWISNYVMTYDMTKTDAINKVASMIYSGNDNDIDIVYEIVNGSGKDSKESIQRYYEVLNQATGFDGMFFGSADNISNFVIVTFFPNQSKYVTNQNPSVDSDMRYSLAPVDPVQPSSSAWERSLTTEEVMALHPDLWNVAAEESETKNPTSVKSTTPSYQKIYEYLKGQDFKGTILDASSGLGYGTELGRDEYGFDVEDIEPFPGDRHEPNYRDYSKLDKKYDVIISNAVLNVLPQDQRDALIVKMGELLKNGGTMFINVRGDDVFNAASADVMNRANKEVYISSTGSYQKGFTPSELVAYIKDALGDGYTVQPTKMFGKVAAIVKKETGRYSLSEEDINGIINQANQNAEVLINGIRKLQSSSGNQRETGLDDYEELQRIFQEPRGVFTQSERAAFEKAVRSVNGVKREVIHLPVDTGVTFKTEVVKDDYLTADMLLSKKINAERGLETVFFFGDLQMSTGNGFEKLGAAGLNTRDNNILFVKLNSTSKQTEITDFAKLTNNAFSPVAIARHERMHSLVGNGNASARRLVDYVNRNKEHLHEFDMVNYAYQITFPQDGYAFDDYVEEIACDLYAGALEVTDPSVQAEIDSLIADIDESIANSSVNGVRYSLPEDDLKEAKRIKKLAEQQSERATERLQKSRKLVQDNTAANKATNRVLDLAQKLKEYVTKRKYVSSSVLANPLLDAWAKELGKLKYRSDIRKASARKILVGFSQFYNKNNDVLTDYYKSMNQEMDANVLGALELLKNNIADKNVNFKPLSLEELQAAEVILGAADALFRNFDTVVVDGKRELTQTLAEQEIEILQAGDPKEYKKFVKAMLLAQKYLNNATDPRAVIKWLEHYDENGILTKLFKSITDGETASMKQNVVFMTPFEDFLKKHKKYNKRLAETKITLDAIGGQVNLTVGQAIALYELTKREQAQRGLVESGVSFADDNGLTKSARFFGEGKYSEEEIKKYAEQIRDKVAQHLTAEDMEFIGLVEDFFNNQSKAVKTEADMELYGYTNALEEFYYPIKRAASTIATSFSNVQSLMADIAAMNTFSFNKDTVKNARNQLYLNSVYDTVQQHARLMSVYANMYKALEAFSRVMNRNIGTSTEVTSVRKYLQEHVWADSETYLKKLMADIQGVKNEQLGDKLWGGLRGAFAKAQLGANLKVIFAQTASLPTAMTRLSPSSIAYGITHKVNFKDLDLYSDWAMVRNHEQAIVKAEGVVDKVGKVGDMLSKPIQWTDRLTIGLLWNACQAEVKKAKGLEIGTEENKIEAAKLLESVGRDTQPNYTNTERSGMMRGNQFLKTLTMFTSAPLKQVSRFLEAAGEFSYALKTKNKTKIHMAGKKLRKTLAAILLANMMYCLIGQFFTWLYKKDRKNKAGEEISFAQDYFTDVAGTTIGMFPVAKSVFDYFNKGYDLSSFDFDIINDILNTTGDIVGLAEKAASGEQVERSDFGSALRSTVYSASQLAGIPTKNVMNTVTGLFKRFDPEVAYNMDSFFYGQDYRKDLNAYVAEGNEKMSEMLMDLYTKENTGTMSKDAQKTLLNLYTQGYDVLPKSIGNKISYSYTDENGDTQTESFTLNAQQKKQFKAIYSEATPVIEAMLDSKAFQKLSEENQAKAIRSVNNAYYIKAKNAVTETATANSLLTYFPKDTGKYATILAGLSDVTADTDKKGNVINGTKKQNVYKYLTSNGLTKNEALYVMAVKGYSLKNLPVSEANARKMLLKYILSLPVSQSEKAAIAEHCGFTVKGNRIISKNG